MPDSSLELSSASSEYNEATVSCSVSLSADSFAVDNSTISSSTTGSGDGGTVFLVAGNLTLRNGAVVSATSTAEGEAGRIVIGVGDTFEMTDSMVTTSATSADGGDIDIRVATLLNLTDSAITTSVGTGQGGGGNIFIDPEFVILNGSRIQANAFGGPGGNIVIVADNFFASPDSIIEASSELGIDGNVVIDSPDTDLSGALAVLPEDIVDAASQFARQCAARGRGFRASLVGEGRGGLPVGPGGPMPSFYAATVAPTNEEQGGASPDLDIAVDPDSDRGDAEVESAQVASERGFVPATLVLKCDT